MKMTLLQRLRSNAAETLAEVIIAITVLSLGTGSATILVLTSVNATVSGENRLVAYNLAREGVEAVRNIRDTNWLRFPGDRDQCWDTYNLVNPTLCAITVNKLGGPNPFIVSPDFTTPNAYFTWNISATSTPADWKLYTIDINGVDDPSNPPTLGGTFYTHGGLSAGAIESPFSRTITIVKTSGSSTVPARMLVTATVSWEERGVPRSVVFKDQLINH